LLVLAVIPMSYIRLNGHGIGVVLRSEHDGVKKGDYVHGFFREYSFSSLFWIH